MEVQEGHRWQGDQDDYIYYEGGMKTKLEIEDRMKEIRKDIVKYRKWVNTSCGNPGENETARSAYGMATTEHQTLHWVIND